MTEPDWNQTGQRASEAMAIMKAAATGATDSLVVTLGDLKRVDVRDGDVFVLFSEYTWTMQQRLEVQQMLSTELGHPVVVIPDGMELALIRREQLDSGTT